MTTTLTEAEFKEALRSIGIAMEKLPQEQRDAYCKAQVFALLDKEIN